MKKTPFILLFLFAVANVLAGPQGVKHRGIFVNDEDWGLRPWAVRHFGEEQQIGTGAYEKIFALMKEHGLNLIWPAMHEGGYEFVSRPENMALAAKWGIRVGTSHCEPMLRNNCYLSSAEKKKWSWLGNKDFITGYWKWSVANYATNDVLWTIGMRGIHDGRLQDGKTTEEKRAVLEDVFAAQTNLLAAAGIADAPKVFVPYKEVLPVFNSGLKVPAGTTIMWVNDNFGYIRRLGGPQCAEYGGGIYWHVSYYGRPHGYLHLCTTPPAFMWYELVAKCWENGVRDVWMVNVGDVFQAELLIYALGKFSSDPDAWGPDAQSKILLAWTKDFLGNENAALAAHLAEYFNLGFIRKPEHMCAQWTAKLPPSLKASLRERYARLLAGDIALEATLPEAKRDEYFRKIGYQVRFLAHAGLIHLDGRDKEYARSVLDPLAARWDSLDGGAWAGFWADTLDDRNRWSSQMQWAWNEPADPAAVDHRGESRAAYVATSYNGEEEPRWLEPVANTPANGGAWTEVAGLGTSAKALALLPVRQGVGAGASLEYKLDDAPAKTLVLQFLPDFALWPGLKLRVGVSFAGGEEKVVEVPRSNSNLGEKDPVRAIAVQDNFIRVALDIPDGADAFTIRAIDPGVVIDRVGVFQRPR